MSVRFAIGIGARRGVCAEEIVALVRRAAARAGVEISPRTLGRAPSPRVRGEGWGEGPGAPAAMSMEGMTSVASSAIGTIPLAPHPPPLPASGERERTYVLFTIDTRRDEPGFREAARLLEMQIVFLPLALLEVRKNDVLTRSSRVERMVGVGSVAETAALVGAGPGSRLLAPRIATQRLTCAIARARANETSEAP